MYNQYSKTSIQFNDAIIPTNQGVVQGSALAPKLFSSRLNLTLNSNPIFQSKIKSNSILAFADELALTFEN